MNLISNPLMEELKQLATAAYEREIKEHLDALALRFEQWREEQISGEELSYLILLFNKGPSLKLYHKYNNLPPRILVAKAIVSGLILQEEISNEAYDYIQNEIDFFENEINEANKRNATFPDNF